MEHPLHPTDTPEQLDNKIVRGLIICALAVLACWATYRFLPFDDSANKGLALLVLIAILWLTEAIHVTITALLIPVTAVLMGIPDMDTKQALSAFADPIIFLFFGGFALASALHVQKLDKKIAFWLISLSGSHLGITALFMFAVTALLSMWISNTATAAMMLPLAMGIMSHLDAKNERSTFLFILLGIAYSASIGGLGTLVGSPPNAIAAKALDLDFSQWMSYGLPLVGVLMPVMMLALFLVFRPNLNRKIEVKTESIPWTTSRVIAMTIFLITAAAWISGSWIKSTFNIASPDTFVALCAAIAVVVFGVSNWRQISDNTDWGVLFLFGGGLTLSAILRSSGASAVLGDQVAHFFGSASPLVIIIAVTTFIIILTEFTSNTASAALLVPVFAGIAEKMGMPASVLVMMIGIGASCAFMLPVATPPNAIVFGTGVIKQSDMLKAGGLLNILCIVILSAWGYLFLM